MRRSLGELVLQLQNLADEAQVKGFEQAALAIHDAIVEIKVFEEVLE